MFNAHYLSVNALVSERDGRFETVGVEPSDFVLSLWAVGAGDPPNPSPGLQSGTHGHQTGAAWHSHLRLNLNKSRISSISSDSH